MASLASLLDRATLRRLAGARSFARGEVYFEEGRVGALVEHDGTVAAAVEGSSIYRVRLSSNGGEIRASCTCPLGDDGIFCKHVVAVGFALRATAGGSGRKKTPLQATITLDDVRARLLRRKKEELVALLLDRALEDDQLRERLLLETVSERAADRRGDGARGVAAELRAAIDRAASTGGFVDYRGARGFAGGIDRVIDTIAGLLKKDGAGTVIELCEHALERIEEALGSVDDSDGELSGLLERVQVLHLEACKRARPDPVELARRLFEWEIDGGYDTFYGAIAIYEKVLGAKGIAEYRRLAQAEWSRVPELAPGTNDPNRYGARSRITHLMETLAHLDGDLDALVAIRERDLSHAYAFLQIAQLYREAKKPDLALEWAERGVRAFPTRTDSRLREFLADEYHRRKRHDEAMALLWEEFQERPAMETYRLLKEHADRAKAWPVWREKALNLIRAGIEKRKRENAAQSRRSTGLARWGGFHGADHSELVRIFQWEGDGEAAWREARAGGCSEELWRELAAKREKDHPSDALDVYRVRIDPTVARGGNDAYRAAIGLLRKVRQLLARLGRGEEFAGIVTTARATHKQKRNFVKMLDGARWPQGS